MITLETLLKELSPASLNEIVAGIDRGNAGGSSSGPEGKSKSSKHKSQKSNKSGKSNKSHKSHKSTKPHGFINNAPE